MPKHHDIFQTLRAQIAAGKYTRSRRLPSEMELAQRFGVSRPTAARALRDLQGLGLIERRVGSGTYLRTPAPGGGKDARTVGLFAPGLGHTEILDPIGTEITRAAQSHNLQLIWPDASSAGATAQEAEAVCRRFIDRKVDGVFFAPLENVPEREAVNHHVAEMLHAAGIAVVLLDRDILEFPRRSRFDLVCIDNFQAAFTLADYLVKLGRRRFRFVARAGYPSTTDLRMAGCREAIVRHGLTLDKNWARFGNPADTAFVRGVLRPMPDIIVCANDLTAALLIQTLSGLGVQLPRDISIVGFDDVKYAKLLSVPLTTIRQPCGDIAHTAVQTMLARIKEPSSPSRQILLTGELIVRQSCGNR